MRRLLQVLFCWALAMIAGCACWDGVADYRFHVTVLDQGGNPVANSRVAMTYQSDVDYYGTGERLPMKVFSVTNTDAHGSCTLTKRVHTAGSFPPLVLTERAYFDCLGLRVSGPTGGPWASTRSKCLTRTGMRNCTCRNSMSPAGI